MLIHKLSDLSELSGQGYETRTFGDLSIFLTGGARAMDSNWQRIDPLRQVAERYASSGPRGCAEGLIGTYVLIIQDHDNIHVMSDHAGLRYVFYSEDIISTSFLSLASYMGINPAHDLDDFGCLEFIRFGSTSQGRTVFRHIRRLSGSESLLLNRHTGKVVVAQQDIPLNQCSNYPTSADALERYLQDYARCFDDESISIDLTGGIDSRLNAVIFSSVGLSFETALSGTSDLKEISFAERVAQELGVPFVLSDYTPTKLANDLEVLLSVTDGQCDVIAYDRLAKLARDRVSRGMRLSVSGTAGELLKDFWWIQDLPFWWSRKANIRRLYRLRMETITFPDHWMAEKYRNINVTFVEKKIDEMSLLTQETNTKTYDMIYYRYRVPPIFGAFVSANARLGLRTICPYLDPKVVKFGLEAPRLHRLAAGIHRGIITRLRPEVDRIPTADGRRSRGGVLELFLSLPNITIDLSKRLIKKMAQRIVGKTYFQEASPSGDMASLNNQVRERMIVALEELRELGFIAKAATLDTIPSRFWGRLITMSLILRGTRRENDIHSGHPKSYRTASR